MKKYILFILFSFSIQICNSQQLKALVFDYTQPFTVTALKTTTDSIPVLLPFFSIAAEDGTWPSSILFHISFSLGFLQCRLFSSQRQPNWSPRQWRNPFCYYGANSVGWPRIHSAKLRFLCDVQESAL